MRGKLRQMKGAVWCVIIWAPWVLVLMAIFSSSHFFLTLSYLINGVCIVYSLGFSLVITVWVFISWLFFILESLLLFLAPDLSSSRAPSSKVTLMPALLPAGKTRTHPYPAFPNIAAWVFWGVGTCSPKQLSTATGVELCVVELPEHPEAKVRFP